MFCLITARKLSHQKFEFSLKEKVMGSNLGYLLKLIINYCHLLTEKAKKTQLQLIIFYPKQ